MITHYVYMPLSPHQAVTSCYAAELFDHPAQPYWFPIEDCNCREAAIAKAEEYRAALAVLGDTDPKEDPKYIPHWQRK